MTAIPGSVRVTGFLAPSDSADTYAVTDDAYHRGGFRPVADAAARDAITEGRRKVGMLVYCIAEDKYYQCTVATTPPTWVEAAFGGGETREGVCELVTAARTVLPADNRLFLESDAVGSAVTPISMTIDQAQFVLLDDEGWQITFKVGMNDDGDPVPVFAACSTSEMSIDDATFIQTLYSAQLGDYLTVRYAYAAARRGRFLVVGGKGTWTDDLGGIHVFGSSGAINVDTTYYVDGTTGDDANDGLSWLTAKQTFGFFIAGATDALPREINATVTCNFRNSILARDTNGNLSLTGFRGTGRIDFVGTLTEVETLTVTTFENNRAVRHARIWVNDPGKAWTPGEWRRHFLKIGTNYYPIYDNTATKLYIAPTETLVGTPAASIYSAPEVLTELVTDPGVKVNFATGGTYFMNVTSCQVPVTFTNMWLDEAGNPVAFFNSTEVLLTAVSGTQIYSFYLQRGAYLSCYFNLNNYGYLYSSYSTEYATFCAFDSSDSTGWGWNPYSHTYLWLFGCVFSRQAFGVYLSEYSSTWLARDMVFRDCAVGIQLAAGLLRLVDPLGGSPQLRFDTCLTCIAGFGTIDHTDGHESAGWVVDYEIVFGSSDDVEFSELNARTLQSRTDLSIMYTDVDFNVFPRDEYDNSTSGLLANRYQTAIDELAASSGGGPVTPEFSLSSPRAIINSDHNGELLAAAVVLGGFIYNIDHSVTPGTTVRIGCIGYELKVRCGANTIIMGAGAFIAGIVGLGFGSAGHYVDLIYIGETTPGTYAWGIVGGSGVATEVDGLGAYTTAQFAFNGTGAYVTSLEETAIDLVDDTDFTAVEAVPYVTEGMGYGIVVTPTTATGNLTVILYQDAARLEPVYTMVIDLSDATTYRSTEAFGFELETTGTLYGTAFVSGVGVGETFDIEVTALGLQPTATPIPLATPYGQGIEDDGLGKPRIALSTSSGLDFDGGDNLVIIPDVTAPVTIALGLGGASVTGAVTTTTDEVVSAKKLFTAVGASRLASSGPPTTGTYLTDHEILDSNGIKWRCTTDGTPGNWMLVDSVADPVLDYVTGSLTSGSSEVLEIITTGDIGFFQHIRVWGVVDDPDNYTTEFRVRVYETSSILGREMVWQGVGAAHQSYLTAILPAATLDCTVDNEDMFETDEACVVYASVGRYELARIASRAAATLSFDEVLVDASSWAADTLVCSVAQFDMVPFRNTDGTPANRGRVFLQIRNDHEANAAIFYVQVMPLCTGVTGNSVS